MDSRTAMNKVGALSLSHSPSLSLVSAQLTLVTSDLALA